MAPKQGLFLSNYLQSTAMTVPQFALCESRRLGMNGTRRRGAEFYVDFEYCNDLNDDFSKLQEN